MRVAGSGLLLPLRSGDLLLGGDLDSIRDEARELASPDDEKQEQLGGSDGDRDVRRGSPGPHECVRSLERMIHGRSIRP